MKLAVCNNQIEVSTTVYNKAFIDITLRPSITMPLVVVG